ncbi:unnamed protein product [Rotaria sordida]|uniref:ABC transporter domain-containing protein n=1 Tax=Rotaria sordida TaxID=392033 RepID=A0A815BHF7_9BILA|nr:unnamed protein product [Rotaria sordida]CAF4137649.1 unnamed protein product [Rotaria sordida]
MLSNQIINGNHVASSSYNEKKNELEKCQRHSNLHLEYSQIRQEIDWFYYRNVELPAYNTANYIAQQVLVPIRTVIPFGEQDKDTEEYRKNLFDGKRVSIEKGFILEITRAIVNIVLYSGRSAHWMVILNGLSVEISSGKVVALCGPSAYGKNIKTLNVTWLRSHIGIVSQQPVLFTESIEENIRFEKRNATDDEVQSAVKMSNGLLLVF